MKNQIQFPGKRAETRIEQELRTNVAHIMLSSMDLPAVAAAVPPLSPQRLRARRAGTAGTAFTRKPFAKTLSHSI